MQICEISAYYRDAVNDIRFYQLRGFEWVAMHRNAMDRSREMKPAIPLLGDHGIPIKHELEFEILLSPAQPG